MNYPFEKRKYESTGEKILSSKKAFEDSTNSNVEGAYLESEEERIESEKVAQKTARIENAKKPVLLWGNKKI